jgi:hypothetical protein
MLRDVYLLRRLVAKANVAADGHLTIMKFTTEWRVGFGTPANPEDIYRMPQGATFREAALLCGGWWGSSATDQRTPGGRICYDPVWPKSPRSSS